MTFKNLEWGWKKLQIDERERVRRNPPPPQQRAAVTEHERFVEAAVLHLAASNADHATSQNGVGFNKPDSAQGNRWGARFRCKIGLTDAEWVKASEMVHKYGKQLTRAGIVEEGKPS